MSGIKFNKSDYRFVLFYFIGASIWLLIRWNLEDYTIFEIVTGLPGYIVKNLLLLFMFRWLIHEYLVMKQNYLVFIVLAFLSWEVVGFLDMWRDYYTAHKPWKLPSFDIMLVQNFNRSAGDSGILLGLIFGKKYYDNQLDNIEIENSQKELELRVLRSQYAPHFLYNSLNTIDALIDYSPKEKVKEYISHLAALYRYLIHTKDGDIATLEDEIELAKNYFYLIKTRFENDYNFEIVKNEKPLAHYLPNGSLLTVLENVVKHNTALNDRTINTKISIEKKSVSITNTISKQKTKVESMGNGLKNLSKRYELLSDHEILVEENKDSFKVTLPLLNVIN